MSKPDFSLSQADADDLLREFRHRRDVADDNHRTQEANAWSDAIRLLQAAQNSAYLRREREFAARQDARAVALGLKPSVSIPL